MGYKDRIQEELNQLLDRIFKLDVILNDEETLGTIPATQVNLMFIQHKIMIAYKEVLETRMALIKTKED